MLIYQYKFKKYYKNKEKMKKKIEKTKKYSILKEEGEIYEKFIRYFVNINNIRLCS